MTENSMKVEQIEQFLVRTVLDVCEKVVHLSGV